MFMRLRPIIFTTLLAWFTGQPFSSAQSPDLAGIAHVAFRVSDLQKSRAFYAKLGFEKAFEFTDVGKVVELFVKVNDRQFIELYPRTQDSQRLELMHICFEASDIESLRQTYVQQGLLPSEAKKFKAGNLLFVLHDPEGQLVEYTQYLPGSLHSEDRGKHLGSHRLSEHLQASSTPVKDLASERVFYVDKLKFGNRSPEGVWLHLPGTVADEIELQPAATSAQITFSVADVKKTADVLRRRGLEADVQPDAVTVSDPDGTRIVFRKSGARP